MAVFLVWLGDPAEVDAVVGAPGPWQEVVPSAPGLLLIESDETLSQVYHHVKWLLAEERPLLVAHLHDRPKARGLARGVGSWLRDRLPLPARPPWSPRP